MGSWLSDFHFHCTWDSTWQGINAQCIYATIFKCCSWKALEIDISVFTVVSHFLYFYFYWFIKCFYFVYLIFFFCLILLCNFLLLILFYTFFSSAFLNHLPIIHFITYWLFKTYWRNPFCKHNPFNWRGKEVTDTEKCKANHAYLTDEHY